MDVVVERGKTVPFETLPKKSVALDGYVQGPAVDVENEKFSFDHHDGCIRLVTSATCRQVLDALLLGFDPSGYTVYVNDVDGDTALSVWLLQNPWRAREPRVRDLVDTVATVDAHGPAYPTRHPDLAEAFYQGAMREVSLLVRAKEYAKVDLSKLLERCVKQIDALSFGELNWVPGLDGERTFEITHTGFNGWVMARSDDFVFDLLYSDRYLKAIAYQELEGGTHRYTVGKGSELVGFPVGPHSKEGTILHALNEREPGWGGGSTIGGSPRNPDGSSSRLSPDEVFDIVDRLVRQG